MEKKWKNVENCYWEENIDSFYWATLKILAVIFLAENYSENLQKWAKFEAGPKLNALYFSKTFL